MKIQSMASVSPIVSDPDAARDLYGGTLGLPFEGGQEDYVFTEQLRGVKHFGVWPLQEAAKACFGQEEWPAEIPTPQVSLEFEVGTIEEVNAAAEELRRAGYQLLHDSKDEPWGQTITRMLSSDGVLMGICYTPWFHE